MRLKSFGTFEKRSPERDVTRKFSDICSAEFLDEKRRVIYILTLVYPLGNIGTILTAQKSKMTLLHWYNVSCYGSWSLQTKLRKEH